MVFRGIDEAAGVDHQDVSLIGMRRELVTVGDELAHHDLAIDQVFGAAQTDETDFQSLYPGKGVLLKDNIDGPHELPMSTPVMNTSTPPRPTCSAAVRGRVSMYLVRTQVMTPSSTTTTIMAAVIATVNAGIRHGSV
jgi:hypothetical protein